MSDSTRSKPQSHFGACYKTLRAAGQLICLLLAGALVRQAAADNSVIVGQVRVQCLSDSLARLEVKGPSGFEDRPTFHVVNRSWPGTTLTTNLVLGEVAITTPNYVVHVPAGANSLTDVSVTTPDGQTLYRYDGRLNNSVWLPGPAEAPAAWSFADSPRLVAPTWGITPAPAGAPLASTSGWDTNNDAADVYVFVPGGSYTQLRSDFLKLTGPTEMVPLYALGCWDSRWFDYSEATALAQIDDYRARHFPLEVLVCDTGWRVNASTGYQPNTDLFPDLGRFFAEAHAKHVRVMFNDHPEPVAPSALDPAEVTFRYTNLAQLTAAGLDVWWYDRNWSVSLLSPSPNLRKEVWGMKVYQDEALRAQPSVRPLIMANVDGIDNGFRNNPPNVAAHRYSIQWTGDIGPGNNYLNYAVKNAVHAGVQAAFPYESDDLGGHISNPPPGDYIRWIEYGALSPIYRPHCTHNQARMPWTFGPQAEWVTRRFLQMRYRLLPELYAAARKSYDAGEPILRRLDLDYPQYPEASQETQYLLGHSLLVAPVLQNEIATVPSAWLTTTNGLPGLTGFYFANTDLSGAPALTQVDANIDFNWGTDSPGGAVGADSFSVRWLGNLTVPAAVGDITLCPVSDDGIRVWVDNQLCIDNWGPNDSATTESTIVVKAGQTHQLRVEYLELTGNAIVSLKWRTQTAQQPVWIPPGNWMNAWSGAVLKGPRATFDSQPLDRLPLYLRSGAIFALAPLMPFTGQTPWSPLTLEVYPSTSELAQTTVYEDDTVTTAYKAGQFRTTTLTTWANEVDKTVSIRIDPAAGSYSNAPTQRSWVARFRRPPTWPTDLAATSVTLNGQPLGPVVRRVKNLSAMPLGADNGAPDVEVFEVTVPATPVANGNLLVASFTSSLNPWTCGDIGAVGANGNALEGASTFSNAVLMVRGGGNGIAATNDGFHFLFQPCVGNVQATIKLESQSSLNALAAAGLMVREDLTPTARQVTLAVTPANRALFQVRSVTGNASQLNSSSAVAAPVWLRLVRNGNTFSSYTSPNNQTWTPLNSVTLPGFSAAAYVGPLVSGGITNVLAPATNRFGTALVGVTAEMLGGSYGVDSTNCNTARFSGLTLNNTVSLSPIPNQTTTQSTPTPPIAFAVSAGSGAALSFSAASSNTNLLTPANIVVTGSGGAYAVTLSPNPGVSGTAVVTLTVSDGVSSVSTQFTLTVPPLTGLLLSEDFSGYLPGNLPGQAFRGRGFAAGGSWAGLNASFSSSVATAATVANTGLTWADSPVSSAKITMKGDGSNLQGMPNLATHGPFAAAGLLDPASGTIGGGTVSGTLYVSFFLRALSTSRSSEYGGLHLSRGDDGTGVLVGNEWNAVAYSLWSPQTGTAADLLNSSDNYLVMDNNTHLLVVRISYSPGNDTLTAWLDPSPSQDESAQSSTATYIGSVSGDLSFDRFYFRGGNNSQFEYGALRFGTTWASVLPSTESLTVQLPVTIKPPILAGDSFMFQFAGVAGQSYLVLSNTNLSATGWQTVGEGTFGAGSEAFYVDALTSEPQRYYRVVIPASASSPNAAFQ